MVELVADDDCQVRGHVAPEGPAGPMPFHGWLDFFRVWEALAPETRKRAKGRTGGSDGHGGWTGEREGAR